MFTTQYGSSYCVQIFLYLQTSALSLHRESTHRIDILYNIVKSWMRSELSEQLSPVE